VKIVLRHLAYGGPDEGIDDVVADVRDKAIQEIVIGPSPAESKYADALCCADLFNKSLKMPHATWGLEFWIDHGFLGQLLEPCPNALEPGQANLAKTIVFARVLPLNDLNKLPRSFKSLSD
jgi:hypothetical protein